MATFTPNDARAELVPGKYAPRFQRVFAWYGKRLLTKRFHAVRLAPGGLDLLAGVADVPELVVLVFNHASWWDPMLGFYAHGAFLSGRTPCSPMDARQLARFKFFRRLGMFGINPEHPGSLRLMADYVAMRCAEDVRPLLMMTPQGQFVDVRLPVDVRPGVGLICARAPGVRVLCAAAEYGFWNDQRPEAFLRIQEVVPPAADANARTWTDAVRCTMQQNAAALAQLVQGRDPDGFQTLLGGGAARIHPLYDALLRLTGRSAAIETAHRAPTRQEARG